MARDAKALVKLRDQLNTLAPRRSKESDGTLASAEHLARSPNSDHNPNAAGVVTAIDITHDPKNGLDCDVIVEKLRTSRDRRIEYLIWEWRICNSKSINGEEAFAWRQYDGPNGHTKHFHLSVHNDADLYDDASAWDLDAEVESTEDVAYQDIWATWFGGPEDALSSGKGAYGIFDHNKPGVALPFNFKTHKLPLPKVKVYYNGKSVVCDVVDVGPWNTNDPYWVTKTRPQAETGYDLGQTKWGVRKTNKAGIDLSAKAAEMLGAKAAGKVLVDWEFVENAPPGAVKPSEPPVVPPVVEPRPPSLPKPLPGGVVVDFDELERLWHTDWRKMAKLRREATALLDEMGIELMRLESPEDVDRAMESGKTGYGIAKEREMTEPKQETAKVDVKPASASKINWAQIASMASMAVAAFTGVQMNLDPEHIAITVATVGGAWNAITIILRTWFTKSVTKQAVGK